jgi:hypothetical protein
MMTEITREDAIRVRNVVDRGLVEGLGVPVPGKMCVEAAVCYALGLPHSDDPGCVSRPVRLLKISLNDKPWSSPQARSKGLRRLAIAQLGSSGEIDELGFVSRVVQVVIRNVVPRALRAAASIHTNIKQSQNLINAALRCEEEGTGESVYKAYFVASDILQVIDIKDINAVSFASMSAYNATRTIHNSTFSASISSAGAAHASVSASAGAAHASASAVASALSSLNASSDGAGYSSFFADVYDAEMAKFAEEIVQVLIAMNAPGCRWLDLTPLSS